MRFDEIKNIEFIDISGKIFLVKDFREIPSYNALIVIKYNGEDFDEIASREKVYGEGSESLSYAIFEANKEKFTENNFDGSLIMNIIIPEVQ